MMHAHCSADAQPVRVKSDDGARTSSGGRSRRARLVKAHLDNCTKILAQRTRVAIPHVQLLFGLLARQVALLGRGCRSHLKQDTKRKWKTATQQRAQKREGECTFESNEGCR
jgi:hypothetical protein